MDAISPGSGTQAVYLKLDLNSVKAVKNSKEFVSNDKNTEKNSTAMTTNTSSAGSHEKVTIQSSKLPETTQSNVQGQPAVEETPIIVPSIMSVLLSILGIVYKVKSRGL